MIFTISRNPHDLKDDNNRPKSFVSAWAEVVVVITNDVFPNGRLMLPHEFLEAKGGNTKAETGYVLSVNHPIVFNQYVAGKPVAAKTNQINGQVHIMHAQANGCGQCIQKLKGAAWWEPKWHIDRSDRLMPYDPVSLKTLEDIAKAKAKNQYPNAIGLEYVSAER